MNNMCFKCILVFVIIICIMFSGCNLNIGADNSDYVISQSSVAQSENSSDVNALNFFGEHDEKTLLNSNYEHETERFVVWSSYDSETSLNNIFIYNKETGYQKNIISITSKHYIEFSFDNNVVVCEFDDPTDKTSRYHLYVLNDKGEVTKHTILPIDSKLYNDAVVLGDSIYYLKRKTSESEWYEPRDFVKTDLNGEKEELLYSDVWAFGFYQDAIYLVNKHNILQFNPETKVTSVVYQNNKEDISVGGFGHNYYFEYLVYTDSEGVYSKPGGNAVDLKSGTHYDIVPSFAEENWDCKMNIFSRDKENFYYDFYTTFEGTVDPHIVYSYNIKSREIKEHSRPNLKIVSNFKGETVEFDRPDEQIGIIDSKYYCYYNNDIYFVDLLKSQ